MHINDEKCNKWEGRSREKKNHLKATFCLVPIFFLNILLEHCVSFEWLLPVYLYICSVATISQNTARIKVIVNVNVNCDAHKQQGNNETNFGKEKKNAKFISINKRQKHAQQIFWLKANHILLFPFFSFRVEEKHSWKRIFLFLFSVVRLLFIELKNICRIKNVVDLHCVESTAKNCTEKLHVNNRFMHGHAYVHGSSIICKLISERAIFLSGCRSMYGNVAFFANDQMPLLQCFVGCQCKQNVRRWQAATTPTWPKKNIESNLPHR